jgi:NAD(P)-dependent dehydrogenase (short-subunit alcohol dehydrogenase family)
MSDTPRRIAVITGAAGGLGSAVARLLAARHHDLFLVDNRAEPLEAVKREIGQAGARVETLAADLAQEEECERVIPQAVARLGQVDILINSAAVLHRRALEEVTGESFDFVFHVNCRAPFLLTRAAMADMEKRNWGRVVNFTSIGVYQGGNTMTSAAYEASKGAVAVLTKMFARHGAAKGILVNTVCPGAMKTRMLLEETAPEVVQMSLGQIPLNRLSDPMEVAYMVAWLVSEEASYATGATFDIVGGRVMPG